VGGGVYLEVLVVEQEEHFFEDFGHLLNLRAVVNRMLGNL
jgi:hypothetical protein